MVITKPVTIDEIREYQLIRTPDISAVATYVNMAKGAERTMAQFADETQISASTLSRIVNRKIKASLSIDVIISIYEHRADRDDEFLLDRLARANGFLPKSVAERSINDDTIFFRRNVEINRKRMMKNALVAGVAACGLGIKRVINEPRICPYSNLPKLYPHQQCDFVLDINTETNSSPIKSWCFFLDSKRIDDNNTNNTTSKREANYFIDKLAILFLLDSWDTENMKNTKYSFAFVDEKIFAEFVELLHIAKLHNEMTAILLDPSDYSITDEVWIPGEYEQLSQISVFEVPCPYTEDEDQEE